MACCKCKNRWRDPQGPVFVDDEGNEYCVFHAPADKKGISVDEFNQLVLERIQSYSDNNGLGDFCELTHVVFPGDIDFSAFGVANPLPPMNFFRAVFHGKAGFRGVVFRGGAEFEQAVFHADADFVTAVFEDGIEFGLTQFKTDVWFERAVFKKRAWFYRTSFEGVAGFHEASFKGETVFQRSNSQNTFFHSVSFGGKVKFDEASLNHADFEAATFEQDVSFSRTNLMATTSFKDTVFEKVVSFDKSVFESVTFESTSFKSEANFVFADFINNADFLSTSFSGPIELKGSVFRGETKFVSSMFLSRVSFLAVIFEEPVDFETSTFQFVDFSGATFKSKVSFKNAAFDKGAMFVETLFEDVVSFEGVRAKKQSLLMERVDLKGFLLGPVTSSILDSFSLVSCLWPEGEPFERVDILKEKASIYRKLKKQAVEEHNQLLVSHWHFLEKSVQLNIIKAKFSFFRFLTLTFWYWLTSGFGERPVRAFFALSFTVCLPFIVLTVVSLNHTGITNSYDHAEALRIAAEGIHYLPLVKISLEGLSSLKTVLIPASQLLIMLQATLFGLAVRNRFRR